MKERLIKSKKRVKEFGEVYTPSHIVKKMCDYVNDQIENIEAKILEPACGNGNFLVEILTRRLQFVTNNHTDCRDYEHKAIVAASTIYGVDILQDNCQESRERMQKVWCDYYEQNCKSACLETVKNVAMHIIDTNVVCGNFLTAMCSDGHGKDTDRPLEFREWKFVAGGVICSMPHKLSDMYAKNGFRLPQKVANRMEREK